MQAPNKIVTILDKGEALSTTKKPAPKYNHREKKLPKNYTLDEAKARSALGEKSQIAGDTYKEYKDFKGYYSNQFESKLQQRLQSEAKEEYVGIEEAQEHALDLVLKPLDIEQSILDDFTIVLIGRRRSGKVCFT